MTLNIIMAQFRVCRDLFSKYFYQKLMFKLKSVISTMISNY